MRKHVQACQDRLSAGVWLGNRPEIFLGALGVVRILEAWYVALVLLNGVMTAVIVLGPGSWWLIILLCAPPVVSLQLATLVVRDFALMYAICKASADILMQVEHTSTVMQRSYEELREHFHRMFQRANPETADMLEACFVEFQRLDVDGSGHLDHREFAALIRQLTGEAASEKMLRRLLRMIDIDDSGKVEVQEFLRFSAPLELLEGGAGGDVEQLESRIEQMATLRVSTPEVLAAKGKGKAQTDQKDFELASV